MHNSHASISSSNIHPTLINKRNSIKQQKFNRSKNSYKTLFVSGLKSSVSVRNLYSYFTGCMRVTIKQNRSVSYLKYAFVDYRTSEQAQRSLYRGVDRSLLGHECRVEYATGQSNISKNHQSIDNKKVVISKIPENVSEDDLHRLFAHGRILKYCPARHIHFSPTTTRSEVKDKILTGYAFILYNDEKQAANVIERANQYQINGQSLAVSLYRHQNHRMK
ncbi:unnamed protein product [Adineta steineri]|uniref:RRM domain-containing protein n=1 Tax=Adineta steineri TaxID=433720 RepID=A0A813PYL4_9BILA|nr:unnamed protein product [Adineta steineri]